MDLITLDVAIADHFRELDKAGEIDHLDLFLLLTSTCVKQFGGMNYRMLEKIFRANGFESHLLAVPTEHILKTNPDPRKVVANTNNVFMDNSYHHSMPFGARIFRSEKDMLGYVDAHSLSYDKESNLMNLSLAGGIYLKPRRGTPTPKHDIRKAHLN